MISAKRVGFVRDVTAIATLNAASRTKENRVRLLGSVGSDSKFGSDQVLQSSGFLTMNEIQG